MMFLICTNVISNLSTLQFIFHDWGDEDCVRILKQCKKAISTREPKGKVIIVDTVIGSASKRIFEEAQLLMDLNMMVLVPGKRETRKSGVRCLWMQGLLNTRSVRS